MARAAVVCVDYRQFMANATTAGPALGLVAGGRTKGAEGQRAVPPRPLPSCREPQLT